MIIWWFACAARSQYLVLRTSNSSTFPSITFRSNNLFCNVSTSINRVNLRLSLSRNVQYAQHRNRRFLLVIGFIFYTILSTTKIILIPNFTIMYCLFYSKRLYFICYFVCCNYREFPSMWRIGLVYKVAKLLPLKMKIIYILLESTVVWVIFK